MKAVIFDVGGVLYHNDKTADQSALEAELGLQPGELAQIVFDSPIAHQAMIGQATRREMWADARQKLRLSEMDLARVQQALLPGDTWDQELLAFAKA